MSLTKRHRALAIGHREQSQSSNCRSHQDCGQVDQRTIRTHVLFVTNTSVTMPLYEVLLRCSRGAL